MSDDNQRLELFPYADGSGHIVVVTAISPKDEDEDEDDGYTEPLLSIQAALPIRVSKWPELRDAIDQLVNSIPNPTPGL